jgi:CheY-like chemotaxis protein
MSRPADESPPSRHPGTAACSASQPPPRVLLVDIEPALAGLLAEWLRQAGIDASAAQGAQASSLPCHAELLVTDIPFPRQGASSRLQALALAWPGTPILALSPTFFAGVATGGEVARRLGVAAVLATPVTRNAWLAAVQRLLVRPT